MDEGSEEMKMRVEFRLALKKCMIDVFHVYEGQVEDLEHQIEQLERRIEEGNVANKTILHNEKDAQNRYERLLSKFQVLEADNERYKKDITKLTSRLSAPCVNCGVYEQQLEQQVKAYTQMLSMKDDFIKQLEKQIPDSNNGRHANLRMRYDSRMRELETQLSEVDKSADGGSPQAQHKDQPCEVRQISNEYESRQAKEGETILKQKENKSPRKNSNHRDHDLNKEPSENLVRKKVIECVIDDHDKDNLEKVNLVKDKRKRDKERSAEDSENECMDPLGDVTGAFSHSTKPKDASPTTSSKLRLNRGEKRGRTRYTEEPNQEHKKSRKTESSAEKKRKLQIVSPVQLTSPGPVLVQDTCNISLVSPNPQKARESGKKRVRIASETSFGEKVKTSDKSAVTVVPETVGMDIMLDSDSEEDDEEQDLGSDGSNESEVLCGSEDKRAEVSGTKDNPEVINSQESNKGNSSLPKEERSNTVSEVDFVKLNRWDSEKERKSHPSTETEESEIVSPVFGGRPLICAGQTSAGASLNSPTLFDSSIEADNQSRRAEQSGGGSPTLLKEIGHARIRSEWDKFHKEKPAMNKINRLLKGGSSKETRFDKSPFLSVKKSRVQTETPNRSENHDGNRSMDTSAPSPSVLSSGVRSQTSRDSSDKIPLPPLGDVNKHNETNSMQCNIPEHTTSTVDLVQDENSPFLIHDENSNSSPASSQGSVVVRKASLRRSTRSLSQRNSQDKTDKQVVDAFSVLTRRRTRGVGPLVMEKSDDSRPPKKYKQSTLSQAFIPEGKKTRRGEYSSNGDRCKKTLEKEYNGGEELDGMTPEEQEKYLMEKAMKESLKTHNVHQQLSQEHLKVDESEKQKGKSKGAKNQEDPHQTLDNDLEVTHQQPVMSQIHLDSEMSLRPPMFSSTPHHSRHQTHSNFKKPSTPKNKKRCSKHKAAGVESVETVGEEDSCPPMLPPHNLNLSIDPDVRLTQYDPSFVHPHAAAKVPSQGFLEPVSMLDIDEAQEASEKSQKRKHKSKAIQGSQRNELRSSIKDASEAEESAVSAVFGPSRLRRVTQSTQQITQHSARPADSESDVFAEHAFAGPSHFEPLKDDSFDIVPRKRKDEKTEFAHIDVVRKKADRNKLDAFSCMECENYFGGLGLSEEEKQERMKNCRHKAKYAPPDTPEHYWSINFPDTQECEARGYLNTTQAAPSKSRRRKPYKKLFRARDSVGATLGQEEDVCGEEQVSDFSDS